MQRQIITSVLLILLWGLGCGALVAPVQAGSDSFFYATAPDNLQVILGKARQKNQGILIFFEMEGCSECRKLKETLLSDPAVQEYYQRHFVSVSLNLFSPAPLHDFGGEVCSQSEFARANQVRVSPTLIFYDAAGKPLTRFSGPIKDAREFLQLGRYVQEAAYEDAPFRAWQQRSVP